MSIFPHSTPYLQQENLLKQMETNCSQPGTKSPLLEVEKAFDCKEYNS